MKNLKVKTVIATVVSIGLLSSMVSMPAYSATYFECKPGYTFQTKGKASRCFKAGKDLFKSPNACVSVTIPVINRSVGHFLKKDHAGRADKCVGTYKVGPIRETSAVDLSCPSGYKLDVRQGADRCKKRIRAEAIPADKRTNK